MKRLLLSSAFCIALAQLATAQTLQKATTPTNQDPFANKKLPRTPKSVAHNKVHQKKTIQTLVPIEETIPVEKKVGKQ